jgi:hypothetical protein
VEEFECDLLGWEGVFAHMKKKTREPQCRGDEGKYQGISKRIPRKRIDNSFLVFKFKIPVR